MKLHAEDVLVLDGRGEARGVLGFGDACVGDRRAIGMREVHG
jgi:hypothetical protein